MTIDLAPFTADPRVDLLAPRPLAAGRCVLLWVSRTQRAWDNRAADLAIALADALDVPVVACFCLVSAYPRATLRAYTFMAEGLAELPDAFLERGIGWIGLEGDPTAEIPQLAERLHAAAIVTDLDPIRTGRAWRQHVAGRSTVPLLVVDADTVVPSATFPKEEWAPRTIRPKILRAMTGGVTPSPNPAPRRRSTMRDGIDPLDRLATLPLDRSVGPVRAVRGGAAAARQRLEAFLATRLASYDQRRNDPTVAGTTGLSAYLHFGQISVETVVEQVLARRGDVPDQAIDAFVNEIVVQRELCINFTLRNSDYDRFAGIPDWAKKTLAEHAADPRPARYSRATLDAGETADPLWNACQRQIVRDGYLNNRLRMYWAKQLPLWTETAEEAFEIAVELNDRYFIDGRDPNGYAGIAWSIGGRHDRPFPPKRPILGLVRSMSRNGQRKFFDIDRYIALVDAGPDSSNDPDIWRMAGTDSQERR